MINAIANILHIAQFHRRLLCALDQQFLQILHFANVKLNKFTNLFQILKFNLELSQNKT